MFSLLFLKLYILHFQADVNIPACIDELLQEKRSYSCVVGRADLVK